jgi:hypothetical protein
MSSQRPSFCSWFIGFYSCEARRESLPAQFGASERRVAIQEVRGAPTAPILHRLGFLLSAVWRVTEQCGDTVLGTSAELPEEAPGARVRSAPPCQKPLTHSHSVLASFPEIALSLKRHSILVTDDAKL